MPAGGAVLVDPQQLNQLLAQNAQMLQLMLQNQNAQPQPQPQPGQAGGAAVGGNQQAYAAS